MSAKGTTLRWRMLFAAIAFMLSTVSSYVVFHRVPTGSDENSYVFQAYNFLDGVIARPEPPMPEAFSSGMVIIHPEAGWLSRYPPGHSLWLLTSIWADAVYPAIGLAAAVAIWFLCGAAFALGIPQALVAVPLLVSPFFFFMYGTQLSHTSGLAAAAMLCWGYIRGRTHNERWPLFIAGLAWSLLFLNRTYTALLMAIPFAVDALWHWLRVRTWRAFQQTALFAVAAGCGVLGYLAYNQLVTNDPFHATYLFYDASESLGFGTRHVYGEVVHHTFANGLGYLWNNVRAMDQWLWGFHGSLLIALVLSIVGWSRRWSPLFLGVTLSVWLGYIGFWYKGVTDAGGPVYFFETLAPLSLLFAFGLSRIWSRAGTHSVTRIAVVVAVLVGLLTWNTVFAVQESITRAPKQKSKSEFVEALNDLPPNSIALVEGFEEVRPGEIIMNAHGEDSDPLILRSLGDENVIVQRLFADRSAYLLRAENPDEPILLDQQPVRVRRLADTFHKRTGQNEPDATGLVVRVASTRDAAGWLAFGRLIRLPKGRYRATWLGQASNISSNAPLGADILIRPDKTSVWEDSLVGSASGTLFQAELDLTNRITALEPRLQYGGSGDVRVRAIHFDELF